MQIGMEAAHDHERSFYHSNQFHILWFVYGLKTAGLE